MIEIENHHMVECPRVNDYVNVDECDQCSFLHSSRSDVFITYCFYDEFLEYVYTGTPFD